MTQSPEILIAEDNPTICKLYGLVLKRAGYQVRTAADGCETLEQIARRRPDLLVLDYMMPNLSGLDVLNHLAYNSETASMPILVVSADSTEMELVFEPVTRQMIVDLVAKPVGMKTFLQHIAHLLDRAQVQAPVPVSM